MIDIPSSPAAAAAAAFSDDIFLLDIPEDPNFDAGEEEELEWLDNKDSFPSLETSFDISHGTLFRPPARARSGGRRRRRNVLTAFETVTARRKCRHCEAEETPQWRVGPEGPKTLCNACGVRYNAGRLLPEYRPVNSPTFSAEMHSNSHRRVTEMRRQKYGVSGRERKTGRS